jgi:hypothetical protein
MTSWFEIRHDYSWMIHQLSPSVQPVQDAWGAKTHMVPNLKLNPLMLPDSKAFLWLMNDNTLVCAKKGDNFSSIDFRGHLLGHLWTTSNWKITMRGLSLSIRMNFAKKKDYHVVYFKFYWLNLLKLNLSQKNDLHWTWVWLTKKSLQNLNSYPFWIFEFLSKIEWFITIRSLAFTTWDCEIY